ncbi:hypothetical protein CGRA01v4_13606 [Colletotrichum graminicola]|nr:hypothetical protein CGRA01v4_13606 [Colletotrichum graminicola]
MLRPSTALLLFSCLPRFCFGACGRSCFLVYCSVCAIHRCAPPFSSPASGPCCSIQ